MTPPKTESWAARIPVQPTDPRPIWSQIEEGMRRLLASGALAPGDPAPSVRDLATELRINPATVSKAYQRLAEDGVVEVRRGEGTFVAASASRVPRGERMKDLREAATRFVSLAVTLGATREDVLREVEASWAQTRDAGGRS